jgi:radical SAM protein with 4Fe4S-binding SPASM domain
MLRKAPLAHLARLGRSYVAYRRGRLRLDYLPFRLWVEPSSRCNLACPMCAQRTISETEKGLMDVALFRAIVDEVRGFAREINITHRGEPLLHPEIAQMVEYASSRGILTRLHTNATLLDERASRRLIEAGLDLLSFSIDGYDKKQYEINRVGASFEQVVANVQGFLTLKRSLGSRTPYTVVQVIEMPGQARPQDVKASFWNLFDGLPLNEAYVKGPTNWAGSCQIPGSDASPAGEYQPCTFLWYSLTVFWDGRVFPCPQDFSDANLLGSVQTRTLKEIWNGDAMVSLRETMSDDRYEELHPCRICDRLFRQRVAGLPRRNVWPFLVENVLGYTGAKKLAPRGL